MDGEVSRGCEDIVGKALAKQSFKSVFARVRSSRFHELSSKTCIVTRTLRFSLAFMHSAHQNSREMFIQLKSHAPHKLFFAEIFVHCV